MKILFKELPYGAHGRNAMNQSGVEVSVMPTGFVGETKIVLSPIKKDFSVADGCRVSIRDTAAPAVCAAMLDIEKHYVILLSWMLSEKTVTGERNGRDLIGNFKIRHIGRQRSELEDFETGEIFNVDNKTIRPI